MQILIAEDEAIIAESLYQVLLQLGHQPLEPACNYEEAIEILHTASPDLAIVDINIGEHFSGFKVAAALNKTNIPFIFLTALYDKETIDRAKEFNPAAYLVKPFNKENLFATIELAANQQEFKRNSSEKELPPIFFKDGIKSVSVVAAEIIYIEVDGKYAHLFLQHGKKHTLRISLHDLITQLNFSSLIQVHKSFAVNIQSITQIKYAEIFAEDISIPLGRSYRDVLLNKVQC